MRKIGDLLRFWIMNPRLGEQGLERMYRVRASGRGKEFLRFAGVMLRFIDRAASPSTPALKDGVNRFRKSGDWRGGVDFMLLQPRRFGVNSMEEAKTDREPGRIH